MKVLFVGDVHNHKYIFEDVHKLDNEYNFDKIIFMGDYVDDWNTTNDESIETLNTVINLKNTNKDKYVLLLGNHELSYIGFPCSGHKKEREQEVTSILMDNLDIFDLYYTIELNKEFVCTHAGITSSYLRYIVNKVNNNNDINNWKLALDTMNSNKIDYLHLLNYVSPLRGGDKEFSSFMWCDKQEHKYFNCVESYKIPNQIIGHTPVSTVSAIRTLDNSLSEDVLYFVDTHSTYSDGRSFGDKSYLIWNNTDFEIYKSSI